MKLFKNTYRIDSPRLPDWDYGSEGYYYLTLCTKDRVEFFGQIIDEDINLSPIGEIVSEEWLNTGPIRSNMQMDEWIIMPNHMHMIVIITHKIVETPRRGVSTDRGVSTTEYHSQTRAASEKWAGNTIGSMIGQFKGKCTKRIRNTDFPNFGWQSRYYDHIIHSDEELQKIRKYIIANPSNWQDDENNLARTDV